MKKIVVLVALLSFGISFAQQKEDMNLRGERKRVAQGVKSGEINAKEGAVIAHKAVKVNRAERRAKSDGIVTDQERANIARKDRQLDRTIRRTKHN
ncbi:hypothetical protein EQG63_05890 [Flavobacterium amnicola]|jgi:hypothetical protein|uniref:Uncharacterized protein n=1 Tax=Flavobacterium amnicola TaxID=2506422 RepID=A0A4Q1K1S5_9FLAO|nr:hypothetical protein [Flavobacterium amnicola]RXR18973.1 hypothetical protein EQG63_05890 [Flavobacterium amnicola]